MSTFPIKLYGEKVLKQKAAPVEEVTPELVALANDMLETMYNAPGVGLAAPQIGKSIQLIVADVQMDEEKDPHILFNPEIIHSEGSSTYEEGCLSFPGIYTNIERPETITVRFLNTRGQNETLEAHGLLSRCIQHELDHLHGILLVDRMKPADKLLLEGKLKKLAKQKSKP